MRPLQRRRFTDSLYYGLTFRRIRIARLLRLPIEKVLIEKENFLL